MDKPSQHGGPRRKAGRKTELDRNIRCERVNLSLDEKTRRLLRVLGDGNESKGVRIAAQIGYARYQRRKPDEPWPPE